MKWDIPQSVAMRLDCDCINRTDAKEVQKPAGNP
jgi:hypothetical protein